MSEKSKLSTQIRNALLGDLRDYVSLMSLEEGRKEIRESILTGRTNPKAVKERQGPKGAKLQYVTIGYVTRALNLAFGWNWDFEVDEFKTRDIIVEKFCKSTRKKEGIVELHVVVGGRLTVRLGEDVIVKSNFGSAVHKSNIEFGDTVKSAASDCLKKCASMLGLAGDVYGQVDETMEVYLYEEKDAQKQLGKVRSMVANGYLTQIKEGDSRVKLERLKKKVTEAPKVLVGEEDRKRILKKIDNKLSTLDVKSE